MTARRLLVVAQCHGRRVIFGSDSIVGRCASECSTVVLDLGGVLEASHTVHTNVLRTFATRLVLIVGSSVGPRCVTLLVRETLGLQIRITT